MIRRKVVNRLYYAEAALAVLALRASTCGVLGVRHIDLMS